MGMLGDLNKLRKQAKEIDKDFHAKEQMATGLEKMKMANEMIANQTAAMTAATSGPIIDGIDATAQVVSVGMAAGVFNTDIILPVEFLIPAGGHAAPADEDLDHRSPNPDAPRHVGGGPAGKAQSLEPERPGGGLVQADLTSPVSARGLARSARPAASAAGFGAAPAPSAGAAPPCLRATTAAVSIRTPQ